MKSVIIFLYAFHCLYLHTIREVLRSGRCRFETFDYHPCTVIDLTRGSREVLM